ncbi:MAG: hypothetical protein DMF62_01295 [Acidobacteria bacterium]|nr:MAG: hypothetical protein DMF62_01295 [Acidobacteriota bacterium]
MHNAKFTMRNWLARFCILHFAFCIGCSIPNLEPTDCIQARDIVREFYSFHFGNDMNFSAENLERRRRFLTTDLYERLKSEEQKGDPFTRTSDLPKAFRVGECRVVESGVSFNVLLFWKTDTRTEQKSINVLAENIGDKWLIAWVKD